MCGCGGANPGGANPGGLPTLISGALDPAFDTSPPPSPTPADAQTAAVVSGASWGSWVEFGLVLLFLIGGALVLDVSIRRGKAD